MMYALTGNNFASWLDHYRSNEFFFSVGRESWRNINGCVAYRQNSCAHSFLQCKVYCHLWILIRYCCRDHQALDWTTRHKQSCGNALDSVAATQTNPETNPLNKFVFKEFGIEMGQVGYFLVFRVSCIMFLAACFFLFAEFTQPGKRVGENSEEKKSIKTCGTRRVTMLNLVACCFLETGIYARKLSFRSFCDSLLLRKH